MVLWHNKVSTEKPWFFVSIEKPWHFHGYFIVPKHHEKLAENSRLFSRGMSAKGSYACAFRQARGYLPGRTASLPLDRQQFVLLGKQNHTGVNNLPRVVTQPRPGRESNSQPPTPYRRATAVTIEARGKAQP